MLRKSHSISNRLLDFALVGGASSAALVMVSVFALLFLELLIQGLEPIHLSFLFTAPQDAGRSGGIGTIIVSTVLILTVTLAAAAPIGIGTAVFLSENIRIHSNLTKFTRISLDVLAGVPSVVFGLFGGIFFCQTLGLGFSILSGGLTLACMILPVLIRTIEAGLRSVPNEYRQAAAAMGLSQSVTLGYILLPSALPSIAAGFVLSVGRALAETAALIFTSGYVDRMPESLLDSGRSLSTHIYDLSMNVSGGEPMAAAASLTLVILLFIINSVINRLAKFWAKGRIGQ